MKIVFVFRNGFQLCVTCEKFTLEKTVFGTPDGYVIKGITDNKPLYINWDDVICVYRDMGVELNETDPDPEAEE